MATLAQNFEEKHFDTADDLLRAMFPVPALDTKTPNPKFIFRGERSAAWDPVPTALRRIADKTAAIRLVGMHGDHADDQAFAEFQLVRAFIESCDTAVIALPGDSYEFRKQWLGLDVPASEMRWRDPSRWPEDAFLPLLAVAQHYGVHTRLLDWTRSFLVAVYFAAADVIKHRQTASRDECENFQIWALNTELLHLYENVELVMMPGANSQRLGAQRGLFTLVRDRAGRGRPASQTTIIEALTSPNEDPTKPRPLWKITLPCSEAAGVLHRCHQNGIDAATIDPGLAGAAKATLERAAWHWAKGDNGS